MITQESNIKMKIGTSPCGREISTMKYKIYVSGHRTGALHKTIFKGTAEILAA